LTICPLAFGPALRRWPFGEVVYQRPAAASRKEYSPVEKEFAVADDLRLEPIIITEALAEFKNSQILVPIEKAGSPGRTLIQLLLRIPGMTLCVLVPPTLAVRSSNPFNDLKTPRRSARMAVGADLHFSLC
jgi:hypothetical protein